MSSENESLKITNWLIEKSISGVTPLISSNSLANEYLQDKSFKSNRERVNSLINWETSKNFTTVFITNLGRVLIEINKKVGFRLLTKADKRVSLTW